MKASVLVKELQDAINKHGDLEVVYSTASDWDDYYSTFRLGSVHFVESKNGNTFEIRGLY